MNPRSVDIAVYCDFLAIFLALSSDRFELMDRINL
jgi:hypothetical protein